MSAIVSTPIDAEAKNAPRGPVGSSFWTSAVAAYYPQTLMAPT